MLRVILVAMAIVALSGCAATYKPIVPSTLQYDAREGENFSFAYRYGVLSFKGNKRYAKREPRKMVHVVAVEIANNTGKSLKLGENFMLYSGDNPIYPMEPAMVHKDLRQRLGLYLLYSLITFSTYETDPYTGLQTTTATYPIGIPITVGNMVVVGSANKQFKAELMSGNLINREIKDGEIAYGLIGIPDMSYKPITMVLK
jgi:hypothetical protein